MERALHTLAECIRRHPTLPADPVYPSEPLSEALREDAAVRLPAKHCAFKGCRWEGTTDDGLSCHLHSAHGNTLAKVVDIMPGSGSSGEKLVSAYNEAISTVVRQGAPLSTFSIDRRCIHNYTGFLTGQSVESLICMSCARRFPRVDSFVRNEIRWVQAMSHTKPSQTETAGVVAQDERFCGLDQESTRNIFGLANYMRRYGGGPDQPPDLTAHPEEFDD